MKRLKPLYMRLAAAFLLVCLFPFSAWADANAVPLVAGTAETDTPRAYTMPTETLFTEDFSTYSATDGFTPPVGWIADNFKPGDSCAVTAADGGVKISTAAYGKVPRLYKSFSTPLQYERIVMEFDVRFEGAQQSRQFSLRDSGNRWYPVMCYTLGGGLALGNTNKPNTGIMLQNDVVYHVRYELFNTGDSPYTDVYINGESAGRSPAPADWNKQVRCWYFIMSSGSSAASATYIDNVSLRVKPTAYDYNYNRSFSVDTLRFYHEAETQRTYYITEGTLRAEATVGSDIQTDVTMLLVQYKKRGDGLYAQTVACDTQTVPPGGNAALSASLTVQDAANSLVKVFFTEDLAGLSPVVPASYLFPRWDSSRISHPFTNANYKYLLSYSERNRIQSESAAFLQSELSPYLAMSEQAFAEDIESQLSDKLYLDENCTALWRTLQRLASLYTKTGDETAARYAAIGMEAAARSYQNRSKLIYYPFFSYMYMVPALCVYGYDCMYNATCWETLSAETGRDFRKATEDFFFASVMDMYNMLNDRWYTNITPYGIQDAMLVAVTLHHPELVRLMFGWIDTIYSGKHFYADGMWEEGTVDYHKQTSDSLSLLLTVLESCYRDDADYYDALLGLTLPDANLRSRWPLLAKAGSVPKTLRYPDGRTVPVNDAEAGNPDTKQPTDAILEACLKQIAMPNFKHYALSGGDTEGATQLHINFEGQKLYNAHHHTGPLGITFWSAGMELLPDAGYPRGTGTLYHNFHKSPLAHNTSWVWSSGVNYAKNTTDHTESSLLALDFGAGNDGMVQLAEASQTGQGADSAAVKRRALLMIKLEGNRYYAVDVNRLQGGEAHELYLRGSEDEAVAMTTDLETEPHEGTLQDYLASIQKEQGLTDVSTAGNMRTLCKNPKTADGSESFMFSWRGERSGSSVRVFQNGVPNGEVIFSDIPSLRRAKNDISKFGTYTAPQLYRRRLVTDGSVTRYGAVYEGVYKEQSPLVSAVHWVSPTDPSGMTLAAEVVSDTFRDIIYISDDTETREAFGVQFAGRYAVLRLNKLDNSVVWGYVYGAGSVACGAYRLSGGTDQTAVVVRTETSAAADANNAIVVNGTLPQADSLLGSYVMCLTGDGTGYGYPIDGVTQSDGRTRLATAAVPAFRTDGESAVLLYHDGMEKQEKLPQKMNHYSIYRQRSIPGAVTAWIRTSVFNRVS